MSTALATLRQRASGVSGLTLLVGQGATLRPTVREWANEFHNMRTTAFASLRQFDFFAPTITYVAGSTTQVHYIKTSLIRDNDSVVVNNNNHHHHRCDA